MIQIWKRPFGTQSILRFRSSFGLKNTPENGMPVPKSSAYANKEENDLVYIRPRAALVPMPLPSNFRKGYSPLYTAPAISYVSLIKRITLSGSFVGLYLAYLIHSSPNFSTELATLAAGLSLLPWPLVQYFTRDYVTRIFRLYNKNDVPQTLESLTKDESLIMEKMYFGGKRFYNELVKVKNLKLAKTFLGATYWQHTDDQGFKRYYYVSDDLGGIKMDRLWGIVEKNSGINNGRQI